MRSLTAESKLLDAEVFCASLDRLPSGDELKDSLVLFLLGIFVSILCVSKHNCVNSFVGLSMNQALAIAALKLYCI